MYIYLCSYTNMFCIYVLIYNHIPRLDLAPLRRALLMYFLKICMRPWIHRWTMTM